MEVVYNIIKANTSVFKRIAQLCKRKRTTIFLLGCFSSLLIGLSCLSVNFIELAIRILESIQVDSRFKIGEITWSQRLKIFIWGIISTETAIFGSFGLWFRKVEYLQHCIVSNCCLIAYFVLFACRTGINYHMLCTHFMLPVVIAITCGVHLFEIIQQKALNEQQSQIRIEHRTHMHEIENKQLKDHLETSKVALKKRAKDDEKSKSTSRATLREDRSSTSSSDSFNESSYFHKRINYSQIDLNNVNIGFIGGGLITESIVIGLIDHAHINASKIHVSAKSYKNSDKFDILGCNFTTSNCDLFTKYKCEIIFLCFHGSVTKKVKQRLFKTPIALENYPKFVISLVTGISLKKIKRLFPLYEQLKYSLKFYRAVLNYPIRYGLGICTIDANPTSKYFSPELRKMFTKLTDNLFEEIDTVPEAHADFVCCLSSAGLAMSFQYMQSLISATANTGIDEQIATRLTTYLCLTSAHCILDSGFHADDLQEQLFSTASPAETGIKQLENHHFREHIIEAIKESYEQFMQLAS